MLEVYSVTLYVNRVRLKCVVTNIIRMCVNASFKVYEGWPYQCLRGAPIRGNNSLTLHFSVKVLAPQRLNEMGR